jgi:hypothetical protein
MGEHGEKDRKGKSGRVTVISAMCRLDDFPAYVGASSCPHGWITALAGMTRFGLEGRALEMQ